MIDISLEKDRITKSLNELESEFNKGNIPKSHYLSQKKQLTEKLETLAVAERIMKLQGKKTVETPEETIDEAENEELFKKFITSSGLKEKKIGDETKNKISQNTMILAALLIMGFIVGAVSGIYFLNLPGEVSSVSMFTNDSAFPPFVLNNTTNTTNSTQQLLNTSQTVDTPVSTPTETPKTTGTTTGNGSTGGNTGGTGTNGSNGAAGEPGTTKTTTTQTTYRNTNSNYSNN